MIGAALVNKRASELASHRLFDFRFARFVFALLSCRIYVNVHCCYFCVIMFVTMSSQEVKSRCQFLGFAKSVQKMNSINTISGWSRMRRLQRIHCHRFRAIWLLDTIPCGAFMQSHQFDVNSRAMSISSFAASAGGEVAAT